MHRALLFVCRLMQRKVSYETWFKEFFTSNITKSSKTLMICFLYLIFKEKYPFDTKLTKYLPQTAAINDQAVGVHHWSAVQTPGVRVGRGVGVAVTLTEPWTHRINERISNHIHGSFKTYIQMYLQMHKCMIKLGRVETWKIIT